MTARVEITKDEKKRAERREIALAMILAGKKTTRKRLSRGSEGWGCRASDRADGPACAVGLAVLWQAIDLDHYQYPIDVIVERTGFPKEFWQGVSYGFEFSMNRTFSTLEGEDYNDGLEVGRAAAQLLGGV